MVGICMQIAKNMLMLKTESLTQVMWSAFSVAIGVPLVAILVSVCKNTL